MARGGTLPSLHKLSLRVAATGMDAATTDKKLEKFLNQAPLRRKELRRAAEGELSEMNTCLFTAHEMCKIFTEFKPSRVDFWEQRLLSLLGPRELEFYDGISETRTSLMPHHPLLNLFWLICVFSLYPSEEYYESAHDTKSAERYANKKRKMGVNTEPYYGRHLDFARFEHYYYDDSYEGDITDKKTMFWDFAARIDTIPQVASPSRTLQFMEEILNGERMAPPPEGGPSPANIVVMEGGVRKLRLPTDVEVDWASYAVRVHSGADRRAGSSSFQ
jgi:hypothetical protein